MIDSYNLYPLLYYILSYLHEVNNRIENRYIKGNSIIIYNIPCIKYDGMHDYHKLICVCDIRICTFVATNYMKCNIYLGELKISEYTFFINKNYNKQPITKCINKEDSPTKLPEEQQEEQPKELICSEKIKIAQTIFFMDDLFTINRIILYNCGIIVHSNYFGSHIYNYKGERRIIESVDNFDNIQQIIYV